MTYTPPIRTMAELTDADRERLISFERLEHPTEMQRGALASLRLRATTAGDQKRIEALSDRWEAQK